MKKQIIKTNPPQSLNLEVMTYKYDTGSSSRAFCGDANDVILVCASEGGGEAGGEGEGGKVQGLLP